MVDDVSSAHLSMPLLRNAMYFSAEAFRQRQLRSDVSDSRGGPGVGKFAR